jgi:hypothetical protein
MTDLSKTQTEQGEALDDERYATGTAARGPEKSHHDVEAPRAAPETPDEHIAAAREPMAAPPLDDRTSVSGQMDGSAMDHQSTLVKEVPALRARWEAVQVGFVDDPRRAVSDAEALVGDVINEMTAGFRDQRHRLESQWSKGQEASTEQLRQAIQLYGDFFERFLRV